MNRRDVGAPRGEHFPSYPGPPFVMPFQKGMMHKQFWPVREAARRWGCSYRAARLWMLRHPEKCCEIRIVNCRTGRTRWIMAVPVGTAKRAAYSGNPDFLRPEWQRRRAREYWARHPEKRKCLFDIRIK